MGKKNKKFNKIPFSYYAFKGFGKSIVTKQQPNDEFASIIITEETLKRFR